MNQLRLVLSIVCLFTLFSLKGSAEIKYTIDKGQTDTPQLQQNDPGSSILLSPQERIDHVFLKSELIDYGVAPEWNWVEQFGGEEEGYGQDVVTDEQGNVYITGHFSGNLTIADKNLVSNGIRDAIVAKFNREGDLIWLTQLYAAQGERINSFEMCIDHEMNIYITGCYSGSVNIGGTVLQDDGTFTLYFAKLDSDGKILLAQNHRSGNDTEIGFDIDLDNVGNIYILGTHSVHNIGYSWAPSIIIKYDSSGELVWEQEHDERFSALDVYDPSIYLAGNINSYGYCRRWCRNSRQTD